MTPYKIIYGLLLAVLNVIGVILVGVVFLSSSNTNGEGAMFENSFIMFMRQLLYVVLVSLLFSAFTLLLTKAFGKFLPADNVLLKKIFWIQLAGLIAVFLIADAYLWIRFA